MASRVVYSLAGALIVGLLAAPAASADHIEDFVHDNNPWPIEPDECWNGEDDVFCLPGVLIDEAGTLADSCAHDLECIPG